MNAVILVGRVINIVEITDSRTYGTLRIAFADATDGGRKSSEIGVVTRNLAEVQRGCIVLISGHLRVSGDPIIYASDVVVLRLASRQIPLRAKWRFRTGHWRKLHDGRRVFVSAQGRRARRT